MSRSGLRDAKSGDAKRGPAQRSYELEDERDFLLKSLQDLEDEHRVGDVSDADYKRLHDRYTARAAAVLRALGTVNGVSDDEGSEQDGSNGGTEAGDRTARTSGAIAGAGPGQGAALKRTIPAERSAGQLTVGQKVWKKSPLLVGGVICLVAGVTLALIFSNTSARLPGNTASGGVKLSPGQQEQRELAQAAVLEQQGQLSQALQVYEQVLTQDPGNPGALSEAGWLEFEAGVLVGNEKSLEQGESQEQSAVSIDPGLPSARAFLGSMYFVEGEMAEAVVQYGQFLVDKPTVSEMSPFLPDIRQAFSKTRTPLPVIARAGT